MVCVLLSFRVQDYERNVINGVWNFGTGDRLSLSQLHAVSDTEGQVEQAKDDSLFRTQMKRPPYFIETKVAGPITGVVVQDFSIATEIEKFGIWHGMTFNTDPTIFVTQLWHSLNLRTPPREVEVRKIICPYVLIRSETT